LWEKEDLKEAMKGDGGRASTEGISDSSRGGVLESSEEDPKKEARNEESENGDKN
jgi:hypothetical protein